MEESQAKPTINIEYAPAKFHRRVLANLLDFLIFAALTVGLFLGARAIVMNTPNYRDSATSLKQLQLESGIYKENSAETVDLITYLDAQDLSGVAKRDLAKEGIDTFFAFSLQKAGEIQYESILGGYYTYMQNLNLSLNNVPYFLFQNGKAIENEACQATAYNYYDKAYSPVIKELLQSYFLTKIPGAINAMRYQALLVIFAEILPAYALAGILVYLVPPLFFRHTRYTLSKALYRIGLADKTLLSVPAKRFIIRFLIFYFGELLLSLVTFAIPFLISFTLMAFSKRRQGFPDYLLGMVEVDLSNNRLYRDYEEIRLSQVDPHKKSVDFKMMSRG